MRQQHITVEQYREYLQRRKKPVRRKRAPDWKAQGYRSRLEMTEHQRLRNMGVAALYEAIALQVTPRLINASTGSTSQRASTYTPDLYVPRGGLLASGLERGLLIEIKGAYFRDDARAKWKAAVTRWAPVYDMALIEVVDGVSRLTQAWTWSSGIIDVADMARDRDGVSEVGDIVATLWG